MKKYIFKDDVGYVTNEVSTIKAEDANDSEENRIKFVTDLAAISRGKDKSNNPTVRYKQLLKEAAPTHLQIEQFDPYHCPACGHNIVSDFEPNDDNVVLECGSCENQLIGDHENIPSEWVNKMKGSPSRPLEFLPIILSYELIHQDVVLKDINGDNLSRCFTNRIEYNFIDFINAIGRFSYIDDNLIYTNMRTLVNAGVPYEYIPYSCSKTKKLYKQFKAIKLRIPMFSFNHLVTHGTLSKEARSERVVNISKVDYWLPNDFSNRVYDYYVKHDISEQTDEQQRELVKDGKTYGSYGSIILAKMTTTLMGLTDRSLKAHFLIHGNNDTRTYPTMDNVVSFFVALGYPKEIYQRAMLELRYKDMLMVGWYNDPYKWKHLFIERNAEQQVWTNWTQKQTEEIVRAIKDII